MRDLAEGSRQLPDGTLITMTVAEFLAALAEAAPKVEEGQE